jgi:hypothetical protein
MGCYFALDHCDSQLLVLRPNPRLYPFDMINRNRVQLPQIRDAILLRRVRVLRLLGLSSVRHSSSNPPTPIPTPEHRWRPGRHYPSTSHGNHLLPLPKAFGNDVLPPSRTTLLRRLWDAHISDRNIWDGVLGKVQHCKSRNAACWRCIPGCQWARMACQILAT